MGSRRTQALRESRAHPVRSAVLPKIVAELPHKEGEESRADPRRVRSPFEGSQLLSLWVGAGVGAAVRVRSYRRVGGEVDRACEVRGVDRR